jgi:hypothetical protein
LLRSLLSLIWWISSFSRFVCSIWLTCSFRRSWKRESCSVTDSNSPGMRWGPLEVEKDLRWKVALDNLWKSHIDQHWLASIWSVGSRWLLPKQPFAIWQ